MAYFKLELNGKKVTNPEDWQNVEVLMTYDNESVQPNISTTNFTCLLDAAQEIKAWLDANGYFHGIPAKFKVTEGGQSVTAFDGYGDFSQLIEIKPNDLKLPFKYSLPFKELNQLDSFMERANASTWELVKQDGFITESDFSKVLYVVQKPFNTIEVVILSFTLFSATVQLALAVRNLADSTANFVSKLTNGLFGSVNAAVYAALSVVFNAVYVGILVLQLVKLINQLIAVFMPYPRFVKALSLRQYLEKGCEFLGFNFASSISELDKFMIVPENNKKVDNNPFNSPVNDTGLIGSGSNGYIVGELFQICKDMFSAKFKIDGDNVYFESLLNDGFWQNQAASTFKIPDTFISNFKPNVDELSGLKMVEFVQDEQDEWTFINYVGTSYSVITKHQTEINKKASLIRGVDRLTIPFALGNNKDTKNFIETAIGGIVSVVRNIANLLPGVNAGAFLTAYKHIKDALKVSEEIWSVPKLVTTKTIQLENKSFKVLEANHRDKLSAKYLYRNFIKNGSFVSGGNRNQWISLADEVSVPFGFSNFIEMLNSNFMKDQEGNDVRIESVKWIISQDRATISYRKRSAYDTKLIEEFIEPGK